MASKPTHEQAQLHLQLYEERREPRLRQARDWFCANCFADTLDEVMRIAPPGTEPATSCVTGRRSNQLNYAPAYYVV
jgi:hypothetical protein